MASGEPSTGSQTLEPADGHEGRESSPCQILRNTRALGSFFKIGRETGITQVSTTITGPVESPGNANPDNDFRFDSTLGVVGGYIFNLKTSGLTTGTYNLNLTVTGDTFTYGATFQVK